MAAVRDSDLFPQSFEATVRRCIAEGIVGGQGFAVDTSVIRADAHQQKGVGNREELAPENTGRAVTEYLAELDDAAFGAATEVAPKFISPTDPAARWMAAVGVPACYAYCNNYLIDVEHAVIIDVEVTTAVRQAEVGAAQTMLTCTADRFGLWPERLIADTGYGSVAMLNWLVHEQGIESHIPVFDRAARKDGTFSRADFTYDHQSDFYVCPNGKELRHYRRQFEQPRLGVDPECLMRYRASMRGCGPCSLNGRCCPRQPARKILRSVHEGARDLARRIAETDVYVLSGASGRSLRCCLPISSASCTPADCDYEDRAVPATNSISRLPPKTFASWPNCPRPRHHRPQQTERRQHTLLTVANRTLCRKPNGPFSTQSAESGLTALGWAWVKSGHLPRSAFRRSRQTASVRGGPRNAPLCRRCRGIDRVKTCGKLATRTSRQIEARTACIAIGETDGLSKIDLSGRMQRRANGETLLRNEMTESYTPSQRPRLEKPHCIVAGAITALIVVSGCLSIFYSELQLGVNSGFLPAYGSVTFMGDFITAVLLFGQAHASHDKPLACLGSAYAFSAIMIIPHLMAIPGVFSPVSLIGAPASAVWLWVFWHAGFALGVVNFAVRKPGVSERPVAVWGYILGTLAIAIAAIMLATIGEPLLPIILVSGSYGRLTSLGFSPTVLACSVAGLVLVVLRLRHGSTLMIWLAVAMVASVMDVTLTMLGAGRFTLDWYLARVLSLIAGFSVLCALLTEFLRLFTSVSKANRHLEKLSFTDALTELANRRSFEQRLDMEWRRAFREQVPLSMVMIDIDQFKLYNDQFGHPAGDECLRAVAAALTQHARRPWDMPARMGGEEFAVLLPHTEEDRAAKVAELLRSGIEQLRLPHPSSTFQIVTISVGVATLYPSKPGHTPQGLIAAADAALYVAKTTGRNRIHQHVAPGRQDMIDGMMRQMPGIA